jgi:hypothetical protein
MTVVFCDLATLRDFFFGFFFSLTTFVLDLPKPWYYFGQITWPTYRPSLHLWHGTAEEQS